MHLELGGEAAESLDPALRGLHRVRVRVRVRVRCRVRVRVRCRVRVDPALRGLHSSGRGVGSEGFDEARGLRVGGWGRRAKGV